MKNFLILVFSVAILICSTSSIFAHGGVQNSVGNVTATFYMNPLLPVVGQTTTITFLLNDKNNGEKLVGYEGELRVKETGDQNEDHDKVLIDKKVKSDENGSVEFQYKFPTAKIYDIELEFPQVEGDEREVGFLVQPQQIASSPAVQGRPSLVFGVPGIAIGLIIGLIIGKRAGF